MVGWWSRSLVSRMFSRQRRRLVELSGLHRLLVRHRRQQEDLRRVPQLLCHPESLGGLLHSTGVERRDLDRDVDQGEGLEACRRVPDSFGHRRCLAGRSRRRWSAVAEYASSQQSAASRTARSALSPGGAAWRAASRTATLSVSIAPRALKNPRLLARAARTSRARSASARERWATWSRVSR